MNAVQRLIGHAAVLAAASLLAACATGPRPNGVAVPEAIAAAPHQTLAISVAAKGVQIYECRAAAGGGTQAAAFEWAFVAPEAELLDADGRTIGQHGAGPTWTFDDGTRINGRVKARAEAASPGAIPWLLLEARPEAGRSHRFSELGAIQRVNTEGGAAPAAGCTAQAAGTKVRVPYTADYLFYSGR